MFAEGVGPTALEIVAALEAAKIPCAVGGSLALGTWGQPRATKDVDLNAFVGPERYEELMTVLERAGCRFDRTEALARARDGSVIIAHRDVWQVDVFVPSIPFDWVSQQRVKMVSVLGRRVPVLSAESIAVYKLLFFRSKDVLDLETLVSTMQGSLDVAWVRAQLVDMLGADSDRVEKWDEIVRTHGPR